MPKLIKFSLITIGEKKQKRTNSNASLVSIDV